MARKILITGAGSGLGEGAAIGLAQKGHTVIATTESWPQVTALRDKVAGLDLPNLTVTRLNVLDEYDIAHAAKLDFDVLVNNAGIGEGGPIAEIPMSLVRGNFEVNGVRPAGSDAAGCPSLGQGQDQRQGSVRSLDPRRRQSRYGRHLLGDQAMLTRTI